VPAKEAQDTMTEDRGRVLVVEDETEVAATLLDLLAGRDYNVVTATTAEEGLKTVPSMRPNVVLLGLSLPDMSGPDLLTAFRRIDPYVPIIVVTSVVDPDVIKQVRAKEPFHLVHKPFDIDALDRVVSAAVRSNILSV
jgi:two-component system, NtrC family, sensor kinase